MLERRLLFVTGKGGVGKTVISAALATLAAQNGRRVLLADLDGRGDQRFCFGTGPLGFVARELGPNLSGLTMHSEDSLEEYLRLFLRLPRVARIGMLSRTFSFVANAAPGVKEILGVGKLTYELAQGNYDLIVVDAPSTGHVIGHVNAPQIMRELTHVGLVQTQTQAMVDVLSDPNQTGAVIVATPEEMPVTETVELAGRLDAETDVDLAAIIVNRVVPELFSRSGHEVFDRLCGTDRGRATKAGGAGTASVLDAGRFAVRARDSQVAHLERLQTSGIGAPLFVTSEAFGLDTGPELVALVAQSLADELGAS